MSGAGNCATRPSRPGFSTRPASASSRAATSRPLTPRPAMPVVIVNQTLARAYFRGGDAIGQRLTFGRPSPDDAMANDRRRRRRREAGWRSRPRSSPRCTNRTPRMPHIRCRSSCAEAAIRVAMLPAIRREVAALDGEIALYDIRTLEQVVDRSLVGRAVRHDGADRVRRRCAAAGGGRALRCRRLCRYVADKRDRPAPGARRQPIARASDGRVGRASRRPRRARGGPARRRSHSVAWCPTFLFETPPADPDRSPVGRRNSRRSPARSRAMFPRSEPRASIPRCR